MSAEVLRRAAEAIYEEWNEYARGSAWSQVQEFHLAVANWLTGCADRRDITSDVRIEHDLAEQDWYLPALAVARAYLGESA